jgi:SAM-dependent methyltransferase
MNFSSPSPPSNSYQDQLKDILESYPATSSPRELFGTVDDDMWFWMNTSGYRENPVLRQILPTLPPEDVQLRFTGSAGDRTLQEAFSAYSLFKRIVFEHLGRSCTSVLDFGCGWGRLIRFFLKDIDAANLWGIDCHPDVISLCRQTNHWCRFELVEPFPPTFIASESFDVIYCYSVFSHLSEQAHDAWLAEFHRILKPGGIVIATTWPREFILQCAQLRERQAPEFWTKGQSVSFLDTEQTLRDYDGGKYVHEPVGGGDNLDASFFGETCISRSYAARHWTKAFTLIDYMDDRHLCLQNIIVVKK